MSDKSSAIKQNTMPRLIVRIWLCITGWKRWRQRRTIDKAICVLYDLDCWELGDCLRSLSDQMWDNEWQRYNAKNQKNIIYEDEI
jgi:hypothetical protein